MVESHRCSFPFSSSESPETHHYSCQPSSGSDNNSSSDAVQEHYCYSQVEDRHVFGVCNDFCFRDDGVTPVIFEEDDPSSFFCKTESSECQFPFIWNGVEYNECTMDGSEFAWCALHVDTDNVMVGNRYGKCDMATCVTASEETPAPASMEARAVFKGRVEGIILFSQESTMVPVRIDGKLGGLTNEEYTLKLSSEQCDHVGAGADVGGDDIIDTIDNTTEISVEKWGVSLYPGNENIIGGSVRLEETACPLQQDCVVAKTVACANIEEGNGKTLNLTLILIICVVVFSIVLLILTALLVYCCVKRFVSHH